MKTRILSNKVFAAYFLIGLVIGSAAALFFTADAVRDTGHLTYETQQDRILIPAFFWALFVLLMITEAVYAPKLCCLYTFTDDRFICSALFRKKSAIPYDELYITGGKISRKLPMGRKVHGYYYALSAGNPEDANKETGNITVYRVTHSDKLAKKLESVLPEELLPRLRSVTEFINRLREQDKPGSTRIHGEQQDLPMWQIKPLTYDVCIPPLKSNLYEMTDEEAQACFDWYMSVLPERIKYVSETAAHKLGCSVETFDLTPESLIPLWEWFLSVAEKEPASIQHEVIRSDYQLSLQTEYILRDIGMYLGEAFVKNHSSLHWGIKKKPKNSFFYNHTVVQGFVEYNKATNKPFYPVFEPIHMARVQGVGIFDNRAGKEDLYQVYRKWEEKISE